MHILYIAMLLTALVTACDDDEPTKKKPPEEKICYVSTIRNELDHSLHTYFYHPDKKIRRYYSDDYRADFYYDFQNQMTKEEIKKRETGEILGTREFSYNDEGLMDTVEFFDYENGVLSKKVAIVAFEYNSENLIIQEIAYYPVTRIMIKLLYHYDEKGNQTQMDYYDVYSDTTIFRQSVINHYDTCRSVFKGLNYTISYGLWGKTFYDYPHLSKVNNIIRQDVFHSNGELLWYLVYDFHSYTSENYPHDVTITFYNKLGEVLQSQYFYFTYLEEESN